MKAQASLIQAGKLRRRASANESCGCTLRNSQYCPAKRIGLAVVDPRQDHGQNRYSGQRDEVDIEAQRSNAQYMSSKGGTLNCKTDRMGFGKEVVEVV